jgi:hypothetical protein
MLSANDLAQISSIPSQLITERGMDSHLKRRSEIHKVYCSGSKDDPIAPRVDTVVSQIEASCRSIIDGRNTIFHLFNYSISISKGFKKGGTR